MSLKLLKHVPRFGQLACVCLLVGCARSNHAPSPLARWESLFRPGWGVQQIEPESKRAAEIAQADADTEPNAASDKQPAPTKTNRVASAEMPAPKQDAAKSGAEEKSQSIVTAGHAVRPSDPSKAAPSLVPVVANQDQFAKLPAAAAVKSKQSVTGSTEKQKDVLNAGSDAECFDESNAQRESKLALSVIEQTGDGYFDDEQVSEEEFEWDLSEIESPTIANVGTETAAARESKAASPPAVDKPAPLSTVAKPAAQAQVASTLPVIRRRRLGRRPWRAVPRAGN